MATNPGYNRYQNIMDSYAKYKPGKGESDLKYMKQAMAANLTEKAFDADAAKEMAYTQAGISTGLARTEADLAMRNESAARGEEFKYGMQSMGAQFDFQNQFANAQYDRDVGMLNATGVQDRKNMQAQGQQERLNQINAGAQDRMSIGAQGQQDRANIQTQQAAQGARERGNIAAQGK